jgi:hypothetical protein
VFRNICFMKWSILFTGLLFLNMNFFLAELAFLEVHKNKELIENVVKLVSVSGTEEERDALGDEENKLSEQPHLFIAEILLPQLSILPSSHAFQTSDGAKPICGILDTVNPPPEC